MTGSEKLKVPDLTPGPKSASMNEMVNTAVAHWLASKSSVCYERRIFLIRGQKVMIDRDIAELYGVSTKRLNEQVRRNRERFPEDFMFQLTLEEGRSL